MQLVNAHATIFPSQNYLNVGWQDKKIILVVDERMAAKRAVESESSNHGP